MKKLIPILLLLCAVPALAQTGTTTAVTGGPIPTIPEQKFTLSGKVGGFSLNGQTFLDTDAVVEVPVSPNFSLRQDSDMIFLQGSASSSSNSGPLATQIIGGPQYRFKNPFPTTSVLGSPNIQLSAFAEMGISRSSSNQTLDERVGFDLNYQPSLTNPTTINLLEVYYNHGSVPVSVDPATNVTTYGSNAWGIRIGISY